jgi:hypothetical protein
MANTIHSWIEFHSADLHGWWGLRRSQGILFSQAMFMLVVAADSWGCGAFLPFPARRPQAP